jgi:hypothetical protein
MNAGDDHRWLDVLAGRDEETESTAAQEAHALRELIRVQSVEESAAVAIVDPLREVELIDRARGAGLLPTRPTPARPTSSMAPAWRRWLFAPRGAFAAAALAVVMIAGLVRILLPPTETLRSVAGGTVRLESRDPPALKQRLIEELSASGVRVSGYERMGRVGIDADLPEPVSPQVRHVLERHHIPIPKDGVLVVEIDARTDR